eukprot:5949328-Amphidinium_carterae.2
MNLAGDSCVKQRSAKDCVTPTSPTFLSLNFHLSSVAKSPVTSLRHIYIYLGTHQAATMRTQRNQCANARDTSDVFCIVRFTMCLLYRKSTGVASQDRFHMCVGKSLLVLSMTSHLHVVHVFRDTNRFPKIYSGR